MSVNLSIKNVPDDLAEALRRRAEANHRSLQGELMALLTEAVAGGAAHTGLPPILPAKARVPPHRPVTGQRTLAEIDQELRQIIPVTRELPPGASAVEMIRAARDQRNRS